MENPAKENMPSTVEYLAAEEILRGFDPEHFSLSNECPPTHNQHFGADFPGSHIRKAKFTSCRFDGTRFDGNDASASTLAMCSFDGTAFIDVCMNYSMLAGSTFNKSDLNNCGCSNCNFNNVTFSESKVTGCDFARSYFYNAVLKRTAFIHCSFEEAKFRDATFSDVDLTQAGLSYADLDSTTFIRCTMPFWGVLQAFGGLEALARCAGEIQLQYTASATPILASDFLFKLDSLQPYFQKNRQYFILANINIFLGRQMEALNWILEGVKDGLFNRNFRLIRHLCELASRNHFFQKKDLLRLYNLLTAQEASLDMDPHEYQLYLAEIREIRYLLIENPYGLPRLTVTIRTAVPPEDYDSLTEILKVIDASIQAELPQCIYYVSIYRNSPPTIVISICEAFSRLRPYLIFLAGLLLGTGNAAVAALEKTYSIQGMQLDNQEKKIRLGTMQKQEELKTEKMVLENELLKIQIEKEKKALTTIPKEAYQEAATTAEKAKLLEIPPQARKYILSVEYSIQSDGSTAREGLSGVLTGDEPKGKHA